MERSIGDSDDGLRMNEGNTSGNQWDCDRAKWGMGAKCNEGIDGELNPRGGLQNDEPRLPWQRQHPKLGESLGN